MPTVSLNPNNEHWFNRLNDNAAQRGNHYIRQANSKNKNSSNIVFLTLFFKT